MSMIPSNLARVPTFLASRIALSSLGRTNSALLGAQTSLSSGRSINRASDDPIRASSILSINDRAQRANLHRQNLQFAQGLMGILDSTDGPLDNTAKLVLEAKNLASGQIGISSDAGQRAAMAETVDSMIRTLFNNANFASQGIYLFGGSTPNSPPITLTSDGAYRYTARGNGLLTDLGIADQIPLTLGGNNALGETSSRQRGTTDLNPTLTAATRLSDLRGGTRAGRQHRRAHLLLQRRAHRFGRSHRRNHHRRGQRTPHVGHQAVRDRQRGHHPRSRWHHHKRRVDLDRHARHRHAHVHRLPDKLHRR